MMGPINLEVSWIPQCAYKNLCVLLRLLVFVLLLLIVLRLPLLLMVVVGVFVIVIGVMIIAGYYCWLLLLLPQFPPRVPAKSAISNQLHITCTHFAWRYPGDPGNPGGDCAGTVCSIGGGEKEAAQLRPGHDVFGNLAKGDRNFKLIHLPKK